jgi:hypothetical protein
MVEPNKASPPARKPMPENPPENLPVEATPFSQQVAPHRELDASSRPPTRTSEERHTLRGPEEYPMDDLDGTKFFIERPYKVGENPRYPQGRKGDYPENFDLQWVGVSVWGQHQPQIEADFTRKGWNPVYNGDFNNKYRGRFIPYADEGMIMVDGLVLMARSMSWSEKSRAISRNEAYNQVAIKVNQLKQGELNDRVTLQSQHKHLDKTNFVNVSVEGVTVPARED